MNHRTQFLIRLKISASTATADTTHKPCFHPKKGKSSTCYQYLLQIGSNKA